MDQVIEKAYQLRISQLSEKLALLLRQRRMMGWLRLGLLVSAIAATIIIWPSHIGFALAAGALVLAAFLRVVVLDLRLQHNIRHHQHLLTINQREPAIDAHRYPAGENGAAWMPHHHPYAEDLDLLGRASVFEWLHRTTTHAGHDQLAQWLLHAADKPEILRRQEAVKELSVEIAWRQALQAYGMDNPVSKGTAEKLQQWALQDDAFFHHHIFRWLRWILPAISISIVIAYMADYIGNGAFYPFLIVLFAFSGWISKKATPSYDLLNKISPEAESLAMAIGHIESANWTSEWLQEKQAMLGNNGAGSQRQIRLLSKILNRFDYRYNPLVFIPLNMLLLWDLQQMLGLQDWKKRNANSIPQWLNVLGNMEAISSLANLHYNEPSWAMPAFTAVPGVFDSRQLGHPLIPSAKRVCSSFTTEGKGRINVITGSNMAGKSTFLRSVGLAIVLANAGGPVCADSLTLSHCRLMSSMRIADNLEENTSTFYAELKKLKSIIAAVNAHEPVFLLLDEILRGTNSHDRQTGSKALVLQMLKQDAVGIIATHDLSLAELSNAHPEGIRNYHFDVQVDGEELYFDYQLKTGVCTSLNASLLMKKIGIEI